MLAFQLFVATAAALAVAAPALSQAPARVRGDVIAIDQGSLVVRERDGRTVKLNTGAYTVYADVVPSRLDAIEVNDYIGSAVKGPLGSFVAVEIAIIPENMQAGRVSLYDWDPLPDPTAHPTSTLVATSMTNGLVSSVSRAMDASSNGAMTGGVVSAEMLQGAGRRFTVTYDGGSKSFQIAVLPKTPVVRYILSDRSAVLIGSAVMIKTIAGNRAGLVTVGKGVKPPM